MKRLSTYLFSLLVLAFALVSCNEEQEQAFQDDPVSEAAVASEEDIEADFDDALDMSFSAMDITLSENGRVAEDERFQCAEVTKEENTIIIDFGDGCIGPHGRERKGKIIITYTGRYWMPGSVITTTLENYVVNNRQIEGTRTVTNLSASLTDNPEHKIELFDGKITWPNGEFATRNATKYRTWVRNGSPLNDLIELFGTASGINRNGVEYTATVSESTPLIFKRACRPNRVFIPVKGIKVITRVDRPTVTIDYGNGECDNVVTVTYNDVIRDIEL